MQQDCSVGKFLRGFCSEITPELKGFPGLGDWMDYLTSKHFAMGVSSRVLSNYSISPSQ
jgi:hypothetical protein